MEMVDLNGYSNSEGKWRLDQVDLDFGGENPPLDLSFVVFDGAHPSKTTAIIESSIGWVDSSWVAQVACMVGQP